MCFYRLCSCVHPEKREAKSRRQDVNCAPEYKPHPPPHSAPQVWFGSVTTDRPFAVFLFWWEQGPWAAPWVSLGSWLELRPQFPSQCNGNSGLPPSQVMVKANSSDISLSCMTSLSELPLPGRSLKRLGVKGILFWKLALTKRTALCSRHGLSSQTSAIVVSWDNWCNCCSCDSAVLLCQVPSGTHSHPRLHKGPSLSLGSLCWGPSAALGRSWGDLAQEFLMQMVVLSSCWAKCPEQPSPGKAPVGGSSNRGGSLCSGCPREVWLLPMAEFNDKNPLRHALPLRCLWHFPSCVCFFSCPLSEFCCQLWMQEPFTGSCWADPRTISC